MANTGWSGTRISLEGIESPGVCALLGLAVLPAAGEGVREAHAPASFMPDAREDQVEVVFEQVLEQARCYCHAQVGLRVLSAAEGECPQGFGLGLVLAVVVVSGGFDVYLSHWCDAHGLALICSKLEVAGGALTGRYDGAQCVRDEKPRRVRERYALGDFDAVYAYGDTPEDFALLEIADHRWYRGEPMQEACV